MNCQPSLSEDPAEVLRALVATPSVSGQERAAVGVFLRAAAGLGMRTEIDAAGNGIAHRGDERARTHIALLGHIDTVPGEIRTRIEHGVLHGRGSVDAKGPLAAMLFGAALAELPAGVRLSVIAAVGEETPTSPGARFVRDQLRPSACIIGEPSGWDGVTLGYKGRLVLTARSARPCAHSAGPNASACDDVCAWWARVHACVVRWNEGKGPTFDQVQATVQRLNSSSDGLTQRAEMQAGFRLPPTLDPAELRLLLDSHASSAVEIEVVSQERAVVSDRNDPVVRAISGGIRRLAGRPRPKLKTGTSDMNVVAPDWQCPIAAYGPGDSSLDHTPDERLCLDEYRRSIGVLSMAIGSLARELVGAGTGDCKELGLVEDRGVATEVIS